MSSPFTEEDVQRYAERLALTPGLVRDVLSEVAREGRLLPVGAATQWAVRDGLHVTPTRSDEAARRLAKDLTRIHEPRRYEAVTRVATPWVSVPLDESPGQAPTGSNHGG